MSKKIEHSQDLFNEVWEDSHACFEADKSYSQSKNWMGVVFSKKLKKHIHRIARAIEANKSQIEYFHGQEEIGPATGRPHLQFFVKFRGKKRMNGVKELLGDNTMYVEPAEYPDLAVEYTRKQWSRAPEHWDLEYGMYQSARQTMKEKAIDREQAAKESRRLRHEGMVNICMQAPTKDEAFLACVDTYQLESEHPFNMAWNYAVAKKKVDTQDRIRTRAEEIMWRPWQTELEQYLLTASDDRRIDVVLDPQGNSGKSFFKQQYMAKHPNTAIEVMQGKNENMLAQVYQCNFEPKVVFLDLTRFQQEMANLTVTEIIKNGMIHNHKYVVGTKVMEYKPSLVIFTNNELEWDQLTADRWHIWELHKTSPHDMDIHLVHREMDGPTPHEEAQSKIAKKFDSNYYGKRKHLEATFEPHSPKVKLQKRSDGPLRGYEPSPCDDIEDGYERYHCRLSRGFRTDDKVQSSESEEEE